MQTHYLFSRLGEVILRVLQSKPNLGVELAIGLSRRLVHICGIRENSVHHMYQSDFENGCDVLWRLGVADGYYNTQDTFGMISYQNWIEGRIFEKKKVWPPNFQFQTNPEIRILLHDWVENDVVSLVELLAAYLAVACDYGEDKSFMPTSRKPFQPQDEYMHEIAALAYYGYVRKMGAEVAWHDKIGGAMCYAHLWSEGGRSYSEVAESELENNARIAWETMPPTVRKAHFSKRPLDVIGITKLLAYGWKDGKWDLSDRDKEISLSGEIQLARRLVEIADGKR